MNRAIDYILRHLDQSLSLERIAAEACFSPFHFHRLFRARVGETLNQFVKRVRLERALKLMSHGRPQSLTDIAMACGFSSSSDFSRSFKQRYGVPPSKIDIEVFRTSRREDWRAATADPHLEHRVDRLPAGENPDGFVVGLHALPPRRVAYIRVADSFRPGAVSAAAALLVAWADARGLADGQWLGYMWDDPEIVSPEDCRYDVGLEVADFRPEGEISRIDFPEMLVAQLEVRGSLSLEQRALDWLFGTWLPCSGYVPADQPCFEAWIGRPFAQGFEHFELYVQLPVESV